MSHHLPRELPDGWPTETGLSGEVTQVRDPFTGETIAAIASATVEDVTHAVAQARS